MGLFDIFRRHKKKAAEQSTASAQESSAAASQQPSADQEGAASQASQLTAAPRSTGSADSGMSAAPTAPTSAVDQQPTEPAVATSVPADSGASVQPTVGSSATQSTSQPAPVQSTTSAESAVASESTTDSQATVSVTSTGTTFSASVASATSNESAAKEVASVQASSASPMSNTTPSSEEVATSAAAVASSTAAVEEVASTAAATSEAPTSADDSETDQTAKKYDRGLAKSRTGFGARLNRFLANFRHVDEDFFDDLEDMLIESDVGYDMAMKLSDELREEVKLENAKSKQEVSNVIIEKMVDLYDAAGKDEKADLNMAATGPTVIMFVGVNGAGKTTTIGKMAALFKKQGKKVLLAAADTFRAGATEQLDVWAKRDGVDIVTGPENGDPAAVVFDAVQKAKKEDYDILFVDTAGRLQNKVNLMKELAKMKRILTREIPDAPHEVLLVLDATTGQNALNQAKLFKQSTDVTGIVLTKLDGTARGGIVLAIRNELHLPVKYVGLGEHVDDLQKFDASDFVYGLFKGLVDVD
ncbi:signal recognition particle-docking protein FtsY [Limosilactobacillus pontis]|uniref:signal recognition particle-docking protein FtsY n=1 Tax=Limosilactobacillus pontis TaxID=35787 RepID=UPI00241DFC47|nr:signal recognition particle-docking protein FtsY [Limosilactobacillus pontis]